MRRLWMQRLFIERICFTLLLLGPPSYAGFQPILTHRSRPGKLPDCSGRQPGVVAQPGALVMGS
jgi:hypothetical protein